jgi:hypothetical protein
VRPRSHDLSGEQHRALEILAGGEVAPRRHELGQAMADWSDWRPFPDPRKGGVLIAPFGPGCYNVRHGSQLILFGMSGHVAARMASLLPAPLGKGTRNNSRKRKYLEAHLAEIEYQTLACADRSAALQAEREIAKNRNDYKFTT